MTASWKVFKENHLAMPCKTTLLFHVWLQFIANFWPEDFCVICSRPLWYLLYFSLVGRWIWVSKQVQHFGKFQNNCNISIFGWWVLSPHDMGSSYLFVLCLVLLCVAIYSSYQLQRKVRTSIQGICHQDHPFTNCWESLQPQYQTTYLLVRTCQ